MKNVKLGRNYEIQPYVRLGITSDRQGSGDPRLTIGDNAVIRSGTIIYAGTTIGNNLQTGHNVIIREETTVGQSFCVWSNSIIDYGCTIGNSVKVHSNCYVAQYTVIEDNVFIAPGVVISNDIHPGCKHSHECIQGPVIRQGAKIGINATILPFLEIGRKALIGAGSVVTKDVPDGCVVYGNPGRIVKTISELECVTGITDKPYNSEEEP